MSNPSNYFRISVTSRCNMSCYYCHREGNFSKYDSRKELTPHEFYFACRAALESGFRKFKLTGGEPTMRDDITEIISELCRLNLPDLSMITNATRLEELAQDLWRAGLRRLNISLDSLNTSRFLKTQTHPTNITPEKILRGLETAHKTGFTNIKINFVFRDEESINDLKELIEFCNDKNYVIVLLPIIESGNYYSLDGLYELLKNFGILNESMIVDDMKIRKRLITLKTGAKVLLRIDELAELKPYKFCADCEKKELCREGIFPIRLSSEGVLIPCMKGKGHEIDIREFLRKKDHEAILKAFTIINNYYN